MNERANLIVPASIVIAGALIAGAIFMTRDGSDSVAAVGTALEEQGVKNLRLPDATDHLLGSPSAELVIIEYSDTECPFCKNFHATMKQIMSEYGKDGKVAWVYRHFPLAQLHSKAQKESEATECAAELGGKQKFWDYVDHIFEVTPSNDGLDPAMLPKIAVELGLDKKAFETCLASGKFAGLVNAGYEEAIKAGGRGTPYSVIVTKTGDKLPVDGAQPYARMKSIIDGLLKGE